MFQKASPARDTFTFSLRGMATVNGYTMMPAVANDGINRAWSARLSRVHGPLESPAPPATVRQLESLLARYFAHGCCGAA